MATVIRDANSAVGISYQGSALGQLGYNLKNIKDAGLLQSLIIDYMNLQDRNRSTFAKMMLTMSGKSRGIDGARAFWVAGDENASTTV